MPLRLENISTHIKGEQAMHPEATGRLSSILSDLSSIAKHVSFIVNAAGLIDIHGYTGEENVQGEATIKLDAQSNAQFKGVLLDNPYVAGFASEEEESFTEFAVGPERKYLVWTDPLDGSSNFDTNVSIGSIFAIYEKPDVVSPLTEEDFLQPGYRQVCAGYFLYGASTMFVYTTGHGVSGFTLDPRVGEFYLSPSFSNIKIPQSGSIYSVNEGNIHIWKPEVQQYVDYLKTRPKNPCSARYVGSLVADIHRTLLKGGVFLYPADAKHANGKLRVNCELNPLALIMEQAGGVAIDGNQRILDIKPTALHQRSPIIMGSPVEVQQFQEFVAKA